MPKRAILTHILVLALLAPAVHSQPSKTDSRDLTQLFGRIWKVTKAPSEPAPGSIYIFLTNGTLLETSCVETYRIATWTTDKNKPSLLHVVEDGRPAFTAVITELSGDAMQLEQILARSNEKRHILLKAVEREFVCPDLPK